MALSSFTGAHTNLTYPRATIAGMRMSVAFNMYGVRSDEQTGQIRDAEMVALWYRMDVQVQVGQKWQGAPDIQQSASDKSLMQTAIPLVIP
jgi:hypothetical protein